VETLFPVLKLKDIPGVGARLEEKLVAHYGDECRALDAFLAGDVAGLLAVKGMSQRQAVNLVQRALGMKYGVSPSDFLATDEAVRIYEALMEKVTIFSHTEYARLKMGTLFPSSCPDLIEQNRNLAQSAMESAAALEETDLDHFLSEIRPLHSGKPPRIRNRALAVDSAELLEDLKGRGLNEVVDVHLVENIRELRDLALGYDQVTHLGDTLDSLALNEVEDAERLEDWYLAPETALFRYEVNLPILSAALEASRILERVDLLSFHGLDNLEKAMAKLQEGDDEEAQRLDRLLGDLEERVNETIAWTNSELKRIMETRSVTLAGEDLLQALGRGEDLRGLIESRMGDSFYQVLKDARDRLASGLDLMPLEKAKLDEVIPSKVSYPIEEDRSSLIRFQGECRRRLEVRRLDARRELAKDLEETWDLVHGLVVHLLEFDVIYSLGRFALEEDLTMPKFVDEPCLGFEEGRNLSLDEPQPVSYSVGVTGMVEHNERVAILSGVNSGGKTTMLELVAQVAILAHMGMPVPAKACKLSLFQELYYFGKSRGTLGAGAFESTIRKFSVVANEKRKLVLADELEAITEPGASAKIIASLLDELSWGESAAVFVSHLAEEVQRFAKTPVRIDGIEAQGLDENNNLIVDRNPRYNYLAKSTPELIIDRLARSTSGNEGEFYSRLLQKFR